MTKYHSSDYCGSLTDGDSGIGLEMNSLSDTEQRTSGVPYMKLATDGVIERVRPVTMKNSENGDYIFCRTARGTYVAYRTSVVPQWVTRLVQEIEFRQQ